MIRTHVARAVALRLVMPAMLIATPLMLTIVQGCGQGRVPEVKLRGDQFDPVRGLIAETFRRHNISSIAVAAAKDGKIVWQEAFGWADKEEGLPATPDSIYPLASISKSFTATGLMVLVQRGLVDLGRPVNEYLVEARLVSHAGNPEQATVRRVLQHTAGLPTHFNIFFQTETARPPQQDESIRRYGMIVQAPGREFRYSNFGYGLLDRVIATASGKSYARFMEEEVFGPLGMTHSSVLADPGLSQHAVRQYDARGDLVPALDFDHRGASAVQASVHDLIRFGMFHLQNEIQGQERILSADTLSMMQAPSRVFMPEETVGETSMGLGWAVADLGGIRFVVATGGMPGSVSRLALIPEENVAVAILLNSGISETYSPWDLEWETFRALIPGFPQQPEVHAPARPGAPVPEDMRGEWQGTISTHQGDLAARLSIGSPRELVLAIQGVETRPIWVRNPLGEPAFRDGVLQAPFFGSLPVDDCRRSPHVLFLRLRRQGETLGGIIAAVATDRTFWLPYRLQLERVTPAKAE